MSNKTLVITNTESSSKPKRYKAYCTCKHYTDIEQGETYYLNAKIESESGRFNADYHVHEAGFHFETSNLDLYSRLADEWSMLIDDIAHYNTIFAFMSLSLMLYVKANNISYDIVNDWVDQYMRMSNASDIDLAYLTTNMMQEMYDTGHGESVWYAWETDTAFLPGFIKTANITRPHDDWNFSFQCEFNIEDMTLVLQ